jgi:hypothetical protein
MEERNDSDLECEHQHNRRAEEYRRLGEKEKDLAIDQALIRLQNKIHAILNFLETEKKSRIISPSEKNKDQM